MSEGTLGSTAGAPKEQGHDPVWTVLELLRWTTDYFTRAGIDTARLDAEVLLAHALESERLRLYVDYEKPVLAIERDRFRVLVQRRAAERVPVSQLLGQREFWSLPFRVTSDVLTPRPETETLVEAVLAKLRSRATDEAQEDGEVRILDLGTGSGAIALSLASELPTQRSRQRIFPSQHYRLRRKMPIICIRERGFASCKATSFDRLLPSDSTSSFPTHLTWRGVMRNRFHRSFRTSPKWRSLRGSMGWM